MPHLPNSHSNLLASQLQHGLVRHDNTSSSSLALSLSLVHVDTIRFLTILTLLLSIALSKASHYLSIS